MSEQMVVCGLHMEMEMAKEMGTIGMCKSCHYFESWGGLYCQKKKKRLNKEKENCKEWLVQHR